MRDLTYPLPYHLSTEIEILLAEVPDREDTVYKLRRHFGLVYAYGHQDGRMTGAQEKYYDHQYHKTQEKETND